MRFGTGGSGEARLWTVIEGETPVEAGTQRIVNRMVPKRSDGEFKDWREITPGGLRTARKSEAGAWLGGVRYTGFPHPPGVPSLLL